MAVGVPSQTVPPRIVGRYALFEKLATGGMAVVHLGRLVGPVGFARTVAIKQLLPQFASDPEFVKMFLDEIRIATRLRHANVVGTIDVHAEREELFLVMDYVQGETFSRLLKAAASRGQHLPPGLAVNVVVAVLAGLHAAHEATTEEGAPLHLVHRDMSPQNVMVDVDGVARVLDFGVAKAVGRTQLTRDGEIKGKVSYMAPEQIRGGAVDRRADIYATSVMLWEALTLRRLIHAETDAARIFQALNAVHEPPSRYAPGVSDELDAVVMRGLARDAEDRFATAAEMALALERTTPILSAREIGAWVSELGGAVLAQRATRVEEIERSNTAVLVEPTQRLPVEEDALSTQRMSPSFIDLPSSRPPRLLPAWSSRLTLAIGGACVLGIVAIVALFGRHRAAAPSDGAAAVTSVSALSPVAPAAAPIDGVVAVTSVTALVPTVALPSVEEASPPAPSASVPAASSSARPAPPEDRGVMVPAPSRPVASAVPARRSPLEHLPLYKRE